MFGASLWRPKARPEKYAALSAIQTRPIAARRRAGLRACRSTKAAQAAMIKSPPPTTPSPRRSASRHIRQSHNGAPTTQNRETSIHKIVVAGLGLVHNNTHPASTRPTRKPRSMRLAWISPAHSPAANTATMANTKAAQCVGSRKSTDRKPAMRHSAVITRVLSIAAISLKSRGWQDGSSLWHRRAGGNCQQLLTGATETPFTLAEA